MSWYLPTQKRMPVRGACSVVAALHFTFLLGCGVKVGNPEKPKDDGGKVQGMVVMAPVAEAAIAIYRVAADGTKGELVSQTVSNELGAYAASLNGEGPFLIVATGGTYEDEATGVRIANEVVEAIVAEAPASNFVAVTALTTLASKNARRNAGDGLVAAIAAANSSVGAVFGVSTLDIIETPPVDLTSAAASGVRSTDAGTLYGLLLSGLSQALADNDIAPGNLPKLVETMAEDYADGGFDGLQDGAPLSHALTVTPEQVLQGLPAAMERFLASDRNRSGLAPEQVSIPKPTVPATPTERPPVPNRP